MKEMLCMKMGDSVFYRVIARSCLQHFFFLSLFLFVWDFFAINFN